MRNDANHIAIIDIGSNSVRLFIFKLEAGKAEQLFASKYFCGLGKDLGTTGNLNPEAVDLTIGYLKEFREEIKKHNVHTELVIGTAALREAKDAKDFLDRAYQTSGFRIKIIEGEEEARLAALAILSTDRQATGIVADFGGGSLELAEIGNGRIEKKVSLRLGAHYLKSLPDAAADIDKTLRNMLVDNPEMQNPQTLYVIGGSWRSLAKAWLQDAGRENEKLEGLAFLPMEILPFCLSMNSKQPDELIEKYGMEAPRADIMDVSALMLSRLLAVLTPENVKISTSGIRDGLAYDYILTRQD